MSVCRIELLTIEPRPWSATTPKATNPLARSSTPNFEMSSLSLTSFATIRNQVAPMREQELAAFRAAFEPIVAYLTAAAANNNNKATTADGPASAEDVNNNPQQQQQQHSIEVSDMFNLDTPAMSLAVGWLRAMLRYNVPHGKLNRGLMLVLNYRVLAEGYPLATLSTDTTGDLYRARIAGWCVELLQSYFLVLDDIMDHSVTRRGRPCWYQKVGLHSSKFFPRFRKHKQTNSKSKDCFRMRTLIRKQHTRVRM